MIDFTPSDEIREIIMGLDKFVKQVIQPLEKKFGNMENEAILYDERGFYTPEFLEALREVRVKSAEAGYYNLFGVPELGGYGFGATAVALVFEHLTKTYGYSPLVDEIFPRGLFTGGLTPVLKGMTPEVREEMLPGLQSGEIVTCFGLSEPDAGSDVWMIRTKAVQDGDYWVINGTKQWISNGDHAQYAMIFATTDPELVKQRKGGISCFLVPIDGVTCTAISVTKYLGSPGSKVASLSLENARVHKKYIIGKLNDAFHTALSGVDIGRVCVASNCVGIAQWALKQAIEYAKIRKTFGTTIGNHQIIQAMLADCAMDIYAGRNMLLHAAWKMEQQEELPLREISMIKCFCSEMACRVVDKCMQMHGGMGITNELHLEKAWRYVRPMMIFDGTVEIQRTTIAKRLLKGDDDFSK